MVSKRLFLALVCIFLTPFAAAQVSHEAGQINIPGGTLADLFSGGATICTSADSGDNDCEDSQAVWSGASDIYYEGGNVGIGTDTPGYLLEVAGRIKAGGSSGGMWMGEGDQFVGIHSTDEVGFWNSGGWRLTVESSGEVGIGTINPSAKLDVSVGGDGAKAIRIGIDRQWCFMQEGTGSSTALKLSSDCGGSNNNKNFIIETEGDLVVTPPGRICLGGSCKSSWPSGGGVASCSDCDSRFVNYCSDCDSRFVERAGDSMNANLDMNNNEIVDVNYVQTGTICYDGGACEIPLYNCVIDDTACYDTGWLNLQAAGWVNACPEGYHIRSLDKSAGGSYKFKCCAYQIECWPEVGSSVVDYSF